VHKKLGNQHSILVGCHLYQTNKHRACWFVEIVTEFPTVTLLNSAGGMVETASVLVEISRKEIEMKIGLGLSELKKMINVG